MRLFVLLFFTLAAAAFALDQAATAEHAAQMARGLELFNGGVAQVLTEQCVQCHGGDKGTKGGLDLATREALLKGGEEGAAIVPGKSAEGLLMKSIRHEDEELKMPKKADKLSDADIAKIAQWIDAGAPFAKPLIEGRPARDKAKVTDEDRRWWAFQPLSNAPPPPVKNQAWCRTPIDHFILAKLEEKGLAPNPPAAPHQLLRRIYLDLIGLPPTPEEVEAFIRSSSDPSTLNSQLSTLLASPHYGERWGRHWLDLARYAESHGYEQDYDRLNAFHYRDFVIKALNDDLPYDRFIQWQIAGDELAPENIEAWKATGFLAAGTHATQITANQAEKERYDELDDLAATIGTSVLGLTIGCARCHDHKFDPIPTRDYYRLIATFTKTVRSDHALDFQPEKTKAARAAFARQHGEPGEVEAAAASAPKPELTTVLVSSEGLPAVRLHTQGPDFFEKTFVLRRGDLKQKEDEAAQGFLQVLMRAPEQQWIAPPPAQARTPHRRAALAKWLTDSDAGAGQLTARVIVNRLWQHHFGRGLVATPSDFGAQGEKPSHPELLDWLAGELIRNGWRLKPLHKLMLTSATYQQAINHQPSTINFPQRQRLEGEVIRDAILAVTGTLDRRIFGAGTLDPAMLRRSIYFQIKRSQLPPMLTTFDAPDTLGSLGLRSSTTVAPQALLLMNSEHLRAAVRIWANALAPMTTEDAVRRAYLAAFARPPETDELAAARNFLEAQNESHRAAGHAEPAQLALADFCQALLSSNEFVYAE